MPQLEQKVALAGCSDPQDGQARRSGAPHSLQKRASLECSAPQEAQANFTRRVYDEGMEAVPGSGGGLEGAVHGIGRQDMLDHHDRRSDHAGSVAEPARNDSEVACRQW